jgi:imidazolonepropionase-like amidohydrolase
MDSGVRGNGAPQAEQRVVLCGRLIDDLDAPAREGAALVIAGDRIHEIVPVTDVTGTLAQRVVDLSDYTVMPGLVDAHTHIESMAETDAAVLEKSIARRTLEAADNVRRALHSGVTSLRVLGTHNFIDVAVRDAVNEGLAEGPRMQAAGFLISMTGGHGMELERHSSDLPISTGTIFGGVADGEVEMRRLVRYEIRQGVDVVKLAVTGGVLSQSGAVGAQQLDYNEIRAAVEEAAKVQLRVAAHAHGTAGIKAAILAGVSSIEHGSYLDDECIALMLERDVYYTPTLYNLETDLFQKERRFRLQPFVVDKTRALIASLQDSFRRALAAGVPIAAGSDSTYIAGRFTLAIELEAMVRDGMPPTQALRAGTSVAAAAIGWQDRVGAVRPGYYADVIALTGDPRADISVLQDVRCVVKGGEVVRSSSVARGLKIADRGIEPPHTARTGAG